MSPTHTDWKLLEDIRKGAHSVTEDRPSKSEKAAHAKISIANAKLMASIQASREAHAKFRIYEREVYGDKQPTDEEKRTEATNVLRELALFGSEEKVRLAAAQSLLRETGQLVQEDTGDGVLHKRILDEIEAGPAAKGTPPEGAG